MIESRFLKVSTKETAKRRYLNQLKHVTQVLFTILGKCFFGFSEPIKSKLLKSINQLTNRKLRKVTQNHPQNIKGPKNDIKLAVIRKLLNELLIFFQKINFHSKPYVHDFFWNF